MPRAFFDTNVLVYCDDRDAGHKAETARRLLSTAMRDRSGVVSTQVLIEYYAVARRKLHLPAEIALQRARDWALLDVVPTDAELVFRALELHQRAQLSYWDALIVQAALAAGCKTLFTEDLQHGRVIDSLRVVDPFA